MSIKLTTLSHGGGCGCKIAPAVLSDILAALPAAGALYPNLLVGTESSDDAAVYRLNDEQAIIATTDFFMPIVDDAVDFGRIAATNAISDIYAMGGKPILALAVVGMPVDKLPVEVIRDILHGGQTVCEKAGIPVAGGHSIDAPEPIYGLAVLGVVHPDKVRRNDRARAGDVLILGKGIGIGVFADAMKKGKLPDAGYKRLIASATQLNTAGAALADLPEVHAMTDVTGFGVLGHLLEICRGSKLGARLDFAKLPVFAEALELARQGFAPGAAGRNWNSYGKDVMLPEGMELWQRNLLTDPQTSGGLLVACAPEAADAVLGVFRKEGFDFAAVIGEMAEGEARVTVA